MWIAFTGCRVDNATSYRYPEPRVKPTTGLLGLLCRKGHLKATSPRRSRQVPRASRVPGSHRLHIWPASAPKRPLKQGHKPLRALAAHPRRWIRKIVGAGIGIIITVPAAQGGEGRREVGARGAGPGSGGPKPLGCPCPWLRPASAAASLL